MKQPGKNTTRCRAFPVIAGERKSGRVYFGNVRCGVICTIFDMR
jgi:hypothetical protein